MANALMKLMLDNIFYKGQSRRLELLWILYFLDKGDIET